MANKLHEEIIELLRKYSEIEEYINPNFLIGITTLLSDYYNIEDDEVDEWISYMWGW